MATSGVLALALSGTALAQTAPAAAPAPNASDARAAFALRGAYRAIGDAEAGGTSAYLDAAKAHYRAALARLARNDAGAAGEAMAAAALAHAAEAQHPIPAPRDIPAPPPMVAGSGQRPMMMPGGPVAVSGGHGMPGGPGMRGRRGMHERFDATRLAADANLANTAEARDLAQQAIDADIARTHAAFSGNMDEARRQGRVASDLAMAVRSLALADHPPSSGRRRPMAPYAARPTGT